MKRSVFLILCFLSLWACSPGKGKKDKTETDNMTNEKTYQAPERENYLEYYENGVKKIEGKKVDGKRHGKWTYYYENGMMWSEGMYRHGERNGQAIVYYENGKKKLEGKYQEGLRVGKWKVWEADGSLVKIIDLDSMLTSKDSAKLGM